MLRDWALAVFQLLVLLGVHELGGDLPLVAGGVVLVRVLGNLVSRIKEP